MKRPPLILLAAAVSVATFAFYRSSSKGAPSASTTIAPTLERYRFAPISEDQQTLAGKVSEHPVARPALVYQPTVQIAVPGPDLPELVGELRQQFERKFMEEAVDSAWAPKARSTLIDSIRSRLPSTAKLENVDCRSSVCRAEIVHENMDAYNHFLENDVGEVWSGQKVATREGTTSYGGEVMTLFAARVEETAGLAIREPSP